MLNILKSIQDLVDPYAPAAQPDTPPQKVWGFLAEYAKPFKWVLLLNLLTSMLAASAEVGLIYYLGRLVDMLSNSEPAAFWAAHGWELALVMVFILLVRPALQVFDSTLTNLAIRPNIASLGRWRSHNHVLQQPVGWFESDFAGRIANRVVQMPASVGDLSFQIMDVMSFTVAYMIGAGIMLANADPLLLIPLAIWLVFYAGLLRFSLTRIRPAARASSAARSKTLGFIVDSYSNIQSVKLFSHTKRETKQAYDIFETHRQTYCAEMRIFTVMDIGLVLLNGFLIASLIGLSLFMWTTEIATVGVVAAAGTLALRINSMSGWIMGAMSAFFRALGIITEGMESVAQPIQMKDSETAGELDLQHGAIEVQDVSHHYGQGAGGLDHVSMQIAAGEKVGLVGRSGAGKSTLVKAVLRLFDPEEGRVLIDGQDISAVTQASLRAEIGMVQQESSLLHRSILENIKYGRPDASDDDVIAAAKQAEAHDFITTLTDSFGNSGYDAQVGERGVKLSGGQRQRIALARVILKDAPILILDEATSALDSEVEAQIQRTLYGMMEGKTVIAIAHRLSTIAQMDRVLVVDEGRVVENGSHDELIAQGGIYAGLWQRQSGGFIES